jgi:hypothetical protein
MGVFTTTPRTWASGEVVTAVNINAQLRDFANGFGAWTAYTPTLSGFTLGNGTVAGHYLQVGKLIEFGIALTFGTTSAAAAAAPTFTLPVTALAGWNNATMQGRALFTIGSTWEGALFCANTTTVGCYLRGTLDVLANCSTTSPGTWTTGSTIQLGGTYEAA